MKKCSNCNRPLEEEYQVMIFDPEQKFVKCCSEECANELKEENTNVLYGRFCAVDRQCIQVLKKIKRTPREMIERFIKKNGYTYKVEDILESYKEKFTKGYYVSYTMEICIKALENEIKELI